MGVQLASHNEKGGTLAKGVGEMGADTISWSMRDEITGWWKRMNIV
jgi:hypothetical protein